MLEEKAFLKFVANYFNFNETLISRESNIRTLCIVSLFLEGLDYSIKGKIQIDKIKLERKVEIETDGRDITVDLTDFFNHQNENLLYKDKFAIDGFSDFQMKENVLILEIEQLLGFPSTDEDLESFEFQFVKDLIEYYVNKNIP
jgi:hypothetical protein